MSYTSYAQHQDSHLVPARAALSTWAHGTEYYAEVRKVLGAGLSSNALAQVVVLPSFEPEYIVSVEKQNGRYLLLYNTVQRNLHSSFRDEKAEKAVLHTRRAEISPELATALARLWNRAIQQVRYPEPLVSMRSDGVSFVFMAFQAGVGERAGETWSPAAGSTMALLTGIVTDLKEVALAPQNKELQQRLLHYADLLDKQLQVP
ncbi:hypothetical protein [Hymenobacter latericoloratus]|uniref:hypothetical protein n=1 Tax=Hymenobacter latericoloratus TaxID=1411121 RepID=UPI001C0742CF|nr:hypothetical protein [Hymenobacter latericoloratus]